MALTNAERQARYRGSGGRPASPGPGTADQYREWRDALPESLAGSATAELLEQVCDLWICRYWRLSSCQGPRA